MNWRNILGGGFLGWTFGGPIGALLGAALGNAVGDLFGSNEGQGKPFITSEGDFHASLLVLASMVMKADGQIDPRELNHVREQFKRWFGADKANASFVVFNDLAKSRPKITLVCAQVRQHMALQGRIQIVNFLFELAVIDGSLKQAEQAQIARIARYLGLGQLDFQRLHAMHSRIQQYDPYAVMGISRTSTDKDIKATYRRLVKKYHPDAVIGMGKDVVVEAEATFRKIQTAYEQIAKERGIK